MSPTSQCCGVAELKHCSVVLTHYSAYLYVLDIAFCWTRRKA